MDGELLNFLDNIDFYNDRDARPRITRPRPNWFNDYDELDFFKRYRMRKSTALYVLDQIDQNLEFSSNRTMDPRKRSRNILEMALLKSGIATNEDELIDVRKTSKIVNCKKQKIGERKFKDEAKENAMKQKKKIAPRKKLIFEDSNKIISKCSSTVYHEPVVSRRISEYKKNDDSKEVLALKDTSHNDKTTSLILDLPSIDDAAPGPSQINFDTSQGDDTVFRNTDLHSIDDAAPGPSQINFDTLQSDETVSRNMDIPSIDDAAPGPSQINFDTLQSDETVSRNMDLPSIDDAAPGPSQINFDTLQSDETVSRNMDLPSIDDAAPGPSQINFDTLQSDETVSRNMDLPSIDDAAPGPSQINFDTLQSDETVSRNMDLPSIDDAAPGPSQINFDTLQSDETVSRNMDLPSIDDAAPGPSQINFDTLQSEETVSRNMDLPSIDDAAPGSSQINFDTLQSDETIFRNMDLPSIDDAAPGPSQINFDTSQSDETVSRNMDLSSIDDAAPGISGRKRIGKTNIRYVDYMSDEDFSTIFCSAEVDSDEWVGSETSDSDEEHDQSNKKRPQKGKIKKRKQSINKSKETGNINIQENVNTEDENVGQRGLKRKKKNTRKERSALKQSGKSYNRKDGKIVQEKSVQPNPCKGKKCGNNCENVTVEKRQQVFNHFWSLTSERRKDWLVGMTEIENVKRRRATSETRCNTFKYCITEGEGKRFVCLQFLAATLDISQKCIYYTVRNSSLGSAKEDLRGKCEPSNKTKPATKDIVINFIKSLPAVPSHYCRQDSTRVYLPQEYKNIANLYNVYKKRYMDAGVDVVSERIFRKIFTEQFNITFHIPKKDKCLKCTQLQEADPNDPIKIKEKEDHETEKEESFNRFSTHKSIHKNDPATLCSSFDLEKVLNTPHGESMLLYYSRKLAVYNLCFYENGTRKVFCYYWDESNGKRGANEIASILHHYIKSVDERGNIKHLLLYCDCCPGQNRNRTILAMIHCSLQECKNLQTIQINYLLTGHTYMPVDSVHAVIENNLKKTIIYAPSQWYTVFTTARKEPFPYEVEAITFQNFYKWDTVGDKYFKRNLTGKISKVRVATFKKNKPLIISIKQSMNVSAKSYDVDIQSKTKGPLMPCYRSQLPIAKAKYDDLMRLCKDKVIPTPFHHEYSVIPRAASTKDCLPESDIEDEV